MSVTRTPSVWLLSLKSTITGATAGWFIGTTKRARMPLLLMLACTLGITAAHAQNAAPANAPTVLIVGDSISAGFGVAVEQQWPKLLEQKLQAEFPQLTVVPAAISGDTTSGGRARLPQLLSRHQPDVVMIALGGNDGLRGTPVTVIRQNLLAMTQAVQKSGAIALIAGMQIPPNYGPQYTQQFRDAYPAVAEATGADLMPFLLDEVALTPGMMQEDGIHPSDAAQPTLADNVFQYVRAALRASQ